MDSVYAMPSDTLLVLSQNECWTAALRAEAASLGLAVTMAASVPEAIALLAGNPQQFSHVLLDAAMTTASLPVLLQLVAEAASDTPKLILRAPQDLSPSLQQQLRGITVAGREAGWLTDALAAQRRPRPPRMTAEEIRPILAASGLQLRYQPIVRLADRKPMGIEALARLEHPTCGTLPPSEFVPQMEAAGDGWALTLLVIAEALADWGDLRLDELDLNLSLNVPLDVLLAPALPDVLAARCQAAGVPPRRLMLEMTESQIVVDPAALQAPMRALRAHGIGLAIDDIAPVTHDPAALLTLPFSMMKLDRHAVREAADSSATCSFIRRNIDDGHAAGMTLVAEGVEDAALWAHMRKLGADYGQGFHIARPLPAEAIPLWLRDWQMKSEALARD